MGRYVLVTFLSFLTQVWCAPEDLCRDACETLATRFKGTGLGEDAMSHLWSNFQAEVRPACRVVPNSAQEVAEILSVLRTNRCEFAVLAGGMSPFKGGSNIEGGVTIDLVGLKKLVVDSGDDQPPFVITGAGNRWADVYAALAPHHMSATGTRTGNPSVVGSILGGGISYFSEHHGWACDNVIEFEVVLANSSIVTANETQNSDLFWALKGGGNNFGIVTEAKIEAFKNPPTWHTFQRFNMNCQHLVFDRLCTHTTSMPSEIWQIAVTLQWHVPTWQFVITERMVASESPQLPDSLTEVFPNGTSQSHPVLQTMNYQRSVVEMAKKMDDMNKYGYYNFFGTVTVSNDAALLGVLAELFKVQVEAMKYAAGLQVYIVFNPLTTNAMRKMRKHGGNALGLSPEDGPLIIVNINLHWSDARDNKRMRRFMQSLLREFRDAAMHRDMLHPYIFQNHAFDEQQVFAGYGEVNLEKLKAVRKEVDPDEVFQVLQPGYFKLLQREISSSLAEKDEL